MIGDRQDQPDEPATAEIKVAVADERRLIGEALAALIRTMAGFSVTGVFGGDGPACAVGMQHPDILLVGMGAWPGAGFAMVKAMRVDLPDPEVVIVADALDPGLVRFVVDQRLAGLLLSRTSTPDFASSLDQIAHGRAVMPMGWQGMLVDEQDDPLGSLSDRQMEVLTLLAAGCSYEEIATRLFITVNTVKFHVKSIFVRLGVCNRMAAARLLAEHSAPAPAATRPAV
jgi:DNA-binding NarL/FixJ family response regulator